MTPREKVFIGLFLVAVVTAIGLVIYYSREVTSLTELANKSAQAAKEAVAAQEKALASQVEACKKIQASADAAAADYATKLKKQQEAADAVKEAAVAAAIATQKTQDAADCAKKVDKAIQDQMAADKANAIQLQQAAIDAAIVAEQQKAVADKKAAVDQAIKDTDNACAKLRVDDLRQCSLKLSDAAKKYADELEAARVSAAAAQKLADYLIVLATPGKFVLQNEGASNQCLKINQYGSAKSFAFAPCDGTDPEQVFTFDVPTATLRNQVGYCLDDGGVPVSSENGSGNFYMNPNCSTTDSINGNQMFQYKANTLALKNPDKSGCMDSNTGKSLYYWSCDPANHNQRWKIVPVKR